MQSKSAASAERCHYPHWGLVLVGQESDPLFEDAIKHVEQCEVCQSRIDDSSRIDTPWWGEARQSWLEEELPTTVFGNVSHSVVIEVERELPEDTRVEFEKVMLAFLESPRHPELLGRLGRFDIERIIGTGGMGIVLKAHDTELNRVVAIKLLGAHLAHNGSARKRFAREAQAAAAVLHPNVIPIYSVESDGKLPYIVMRCVLGQSLQAKVDQSGPLPLDEVLRIAKQTAAGLAAAHDQGLVHRDVKPANILLEENVERVLLSDFGLARAVDDASLTRTGVVAGTPHYMSPEQARGDAIDTRSDQFSLGSVLYFMLAGHSPFRASGAMGVLHRICNEAPRKLTSIRSDIPCEVVELVERLMAKQASERYASMHTVEREIEGLLASLQSGGLSLGRRQRSGWMPTNRNRSWLSLLAMGVCLGGIWFLPISFREPPTNDQKISENGPVGQPSNFGQSAINSLMMTSAQDSAFYEQANQIERELLQLQIPSASALETDESSFNVQVQAIEFQLQLLKSQLDTVQPPLQIEP